MTTADATAPDKDWRKHRVDEKSADVLVAVARFFRVHHYGPTMKEIRDDTGISSASLVAAYVKRLRGEGLLRFDDGIARSVQPTPLGWARAGIEPPCFSTL